MLDAATAIPLSIAVVFLEFALSSSSSIYIRINKIGYALSNFIYSNMIEFFLTLPYLSQVNLKLQNLSDSYFYKGMSDQFYQFNNL